MAQYTSSAASPGGSVVNVVLTTETNTLTITATSPAGTVATVTIDVNGDLIDAVVSLRNQWTANEPGISSIELSSGIRNAVLAAVNIVKSQSTATIATATETGTTPPAETQAIPVSPATDPQVAQTSIVTNMEITGTSAPTPITGPTGTPFDDNNNLNIGWGLDENGNPVWVGDGYIDATGQTIKSAPVAVTGPTGTPYDDDNNLNPGWMLDENNNPVWVGGDFVEPATQASAQQSYNSAIGLTAAKTNTRSQATAQDQANFNKQEDWRVRLSLATAGKYLYNADDPGILKPLIETKGVIFPYTPSIQVNYAANYDATDLVHSNYKVYQYKNSAVDNIQISCDFTAQDTNEANYLLAVIHFFRSVTKMFYGQDNGPKPGTPPPLCFLTGLGAFQFNEHPLAIVSFNYNLPTDVDYIRAGQITALAGVNQAQANTAPRLGQNLTVGGNPAPTRWNTNNILSQQPITYVPTKMQIQISAVPMVSRNDVSNNFSLTDYASGKLLRGIQNVRGGFW